MIARICVVSVLAIILSVIPAPAGDIEATLDPGGSFRVLDTSSNQLFRIQDDGRVGVGAGVPAGKLHLSDDGPVELLLEADRDNIGETDQPLLTLSQDNGIVKGHFGFVDSSNYLTIQHVYGADTTTVQVGINRNIYLEGDVSVGGGEGADGSAEGIWLDGQSAVWVVGAENKTNEADSAFFVSRGSGQSDGTFHIDRDGHVGIGTTAPTEQFDVAGRVRSRSLGFEFPDGTVQVTSATNLESSLSLPWAGFSPTADTAFSVTNTGSGAALYAQGSAGYVTMGGDQWALHCTGDLKCEGGTLSTRVLEITGGADVAEPFAVRAKETGLSPVPGMVVCIDPNHPGDLSVSDKEYDNRVAGVISGAGGIQPGMVLSQNGTVADGENLVALSGRVYCRVDASTHPVQPGDLLTTSSLPGHAMKACDPGRSHGAILGKAMTPLSTGQGIVLVLVTLH